MLNTNINIRTDNETKAEAQKIFDELGLDMSTAVNIFLKKVVKTKSIPFKISNKSRKTPKLGGWEGKIFMSDDFNEPMEEFKEYME